MTKPKTKKAYFRKLTSLAPGEKLANYPTIPTGLTTKLEQWTQLPADQQHVKVNGADMYCSADHAAAYPTVTIFKPMSDDFITRYNRSNGEISELFTPDDDPDEVLAHASVFAVDGPTGIIAMIRSSQSAPSANALEVFLDEAAPLPVHQRVQPRWGSEAVIERSSIEDFDNYPGGVTEATLRFPTRHDLFNTQLRSGLVAAMEAYADTIGGDLEVTITAKLTHMGKQSEETRRRFFRNLKHDVPPVLRSGSRFSVKLFGDDGTQQVMNLIEERLSVEVDISIDPNGAQGLQQLQANVVSCLSDNLDRIKELYR